MNGGLWLVFLFVKYTNSAERICTAGAPARCMFRIHLHALDFLLSIAFVCSCDLISDEKGRTLPKVVLMFFQQLLIREDLAKGATSLHAKQSLSVDDSGPIRTSSIV